MPFVCFYNPIFGGDSGHYLANAIEFARLTVANFIIYIFPF